MKPIIETKTNVKHQVVCIPGDGIGPEVVESARSIISAAGVSIDWHEALAGKQAFESGIVSGVPKETLELLETTKVALKGPLETPIGHGGKSANVTLRKHFETFANVRPVRELPGIKTPYAGRGINLVVVRENVEDLYAGIEHTQTPDVAQCLKLISTKGCEKISRFAFGLAKAEQRGRVHVATKANIMKQTEGMMKRVFEKVSDEYPDIDGQHILIDNCAHQLVIRPEQFEVIVTTNMNGDIISDLTSGLVGGLGLAPSANIGHEVAVFEAVHGSAPDIAGQDKANPIAIILSSLMMLQHLGEWQAAARIRAALDAVLNSDVGWPADISAGRQVLGTAAFTAEIIEQLDEQVKTEAKAQEPWPIPERSLEVVSNYPEKEEVVGIDVFVSFDGSVSVLSELLDEATQGTFYSLKMISNRGTMVYPESGANPDCVDHWRCRFVLSEPIPKLKVRLIEPLLWRIEGNGITWMHLEKLHRFDGEDAFTKAQGEN
ncbi:MAG: NADP-dependent isocitrate dehydrogenase [Verrucomicrobiota bacterium]